MADFDTTTNPTKAKVEEIIAEEEAKIDARLRSRYTLPLVSLANQAIIRSISLAICATRVRFIMDVKTGDENTKQTGQKNGIDPWKQLEEIVEGKLILDGESLANGRSGFKSNPPDCTPFFKRGVDQW